MSRFFQSLFGIQTSDQASGSGLRTSGSTSNAFPEARSLKSEVRLRKRSLRRKPLEERQMLSVSGVDCFCCDIHTFCDDDTIFQ